MFLKNKRICISMKSFRAYEHNIWKLKSFANFDFDFKLTECNFIFNLLFEWFEIFDVMIIFYYFINLNHFNCWIRTLMTEIYIQSLKNLKHKMKFLVLCCSNQIKLSKSSCVVNKIIKLRILLLCVSLSFVPTFNKNI